jgi:hypothetical protein
MKARIIVTCCLGLLLASGAWAGESGSALKNDTLRAEPFSDAKMAGSLNRGDKVDILERKGAWLRIKAGKSTGWVRLLSIKRGEASKSSDASGLLSVASGRAGTGQVVSTTGVRGLNEEELKSAKFNEEEVKKMEANSISADAAKKFAAGGGLKTRKQDYLPEPKGGAQ